MSLKGKEKLAKRGRKDVDDAEDLDSCEEDDVKKLLHSLSTKMDDLNNTMSAVDKGLNVKMDNLESTMSKMIQEVKDDVDKRFVSLAAEVDQRFVDVIASSELKCNATTSEVSKELNVRVDELRAVHDYRIDNLERYSLDKDLIITGVPLENNDSPFGVLGDICRVLNCNLAENDFATAYRLRTNNANVKGKRTVPIVVKAHSIWAKQELLSSYFKKGDLNLKDLGFQTSARIFINESLTKSNRAIFKLASEAKKSKMIIKYFTRNGLVHVQRCENSKLSCIRHISDLEQMLPPSFVLNGQNMPRNRFRSFNGGNGTSRQQSTNNASSTSSSSNTFSASSGTMNSSNVHTIASGPNPNSTHTVGNLDGNQQLVHDTTSMDMLVENPSNLAG